MLIYAVPYIVVMGNSRKTLENHPWQIFIDRKLHPSLLRLHFIPRSILLCDNHGSIVDVLVSETNWNEVQLETNLPSKLTINQMGREKTNMEFVNYYPIMEGISKKPLPNTQ